MDKKRASEGKAEAVNPQVNCFAELGIQKNDFSHSSSLDSTNIASDYQRVSTC